MLFDWGFKKDTLGCQQLGYFSREIGNDYGLQAFASILLTTHMDEEIAAIRKTIVQSSGSSEQNLKELVLGQWTVWWGLTKFELESF